MGRADGLLGDQIGKRKESVMPRVIHFEIHTENPERAMQFYKNLFGWQFQKWEGPMDYWVILTGNDPEPGINGGLMRRQGPEPVEMQAVNAYICTVQVPSIDEYLSKVGNIGGVIVLPKMAIRSERASCRERV